MQRALEHLLATQNADGGWGTYPGRASSTEATALASLGARAWDAGGANASRSLDWLRTRQQSDGSWRVSDDVPRGSWTTSLAVLALGAADADDPRVASGLEWLLDMEGRTPTFWDQVRAWFTQQPLSDDLDPGLIGWPWEPDTFSWIEPTCYALLAIKRYRALVDARRAADRIADAERLLLDRVCPGGGWNYGNARAQGQDLRPYPDTTALGLLALQDRAGEEATRQGSDALLRLLTHTVSGLALSLALLALPLHGRDASAQRRALEARYEETGFLHETRPIALALIATGTHVAPFRLDARV